MQGDFQSEASLNRIEDPVLGGGGEEEEEGEEEKGGGSQSTKLIKLIKQGLVKGIMGKARAQTVWE